MRFVLTGAPGSGKTTLLTALAERGYGVVPESATDLISRKQREGIDELWRDTLFTTWICDLQRERQQRADAESRHAVTVYDRSPVCTLALARWLGHHWDTQSVRRWPPRSRESARTGSTSEMCCSCSRSAGS